MIESWSVEARRHTGWPLRKVLSILQVSRSGYYRYLRRRSIIASGGGHGPRHPDQVLPQERAAVISLRQGAS